MKTIFALALAFAALCGGCNQPPVHECFHAPCTTPGSR